jgi:hypothetical protein
MQGDQSGISQTTHRGYFNESTSGNVLAVYRQGALQEQAIYGSSRLGLYRGGRTGAVRELGSRQYEISNHLGNVLSVVTDHIHLSPDSAWATVVSTTDYYAFGSSMPGRTFQGEEYRYGFNSQEKVDEIKGSGNHYTAEFWEYDPRVVHRWNRDPVVKPHESPYAILAGNPIWFTDHNGADTIRFNVNSWSRTAQPQLPGQDNTYGNQNLGGVNFGIDVSVAKGPDVFFYNTTHTHFDADGNATTTSSSKRFYPVEDHKNQGNRF